MVATPDVLDRIAAATQQLLYVRLRQVAAKEGSLWVLVRLASSAYFQDSTLTTANTQAQLVQLTKEQSGALLERELLVPSALLKTLLAEKWLQVGRSEEVNDALGRQIAVKLQLPSVFTSRDQAEVEIMGFRLDPLGRLAQWKGQRQFKEATAGEMLPILAEENRRALRLYDSKDWKAAYRFGEQFCYEVELNLRVVAISSPSFQAKPLSANPDTPFTLFSLRLDE